MSRRLLFTARAEALAVSQVSAQAEIDRETCDAAIRAAVRAHGVRGCAARLAYEYGRDPDVVVRRMRWATSTVAALYGAPEAA
jgi:hypothetical protein